LLRRDTLRTICEENGLVRRKAGRVRDLFTVTSKVADLVRFEDWGAQPSHDSSEAEVSSKLRAVVEHAALVEVQRELEGKDGGDPPSPIAKRLWTEHGQTIRDTIGALAPAVGAFHADLVSVLEDRLAVDALFDLCPIFDRAPELRGRRLSDL